MMNPMEVNRVPQTTGSRIAVPLLVGCGAFVIGVGLTFGYVQWQSQQQKLAEMAHMLDEMRSEQQVLAARGEVTRNAPVDLLSVAAPVTAAPQTAPAPIPVAAPAPTEDTSRTTAERIRELVTREDDPMVSEAIAIDIRRRETMSVAIQGVNELVDAAVAGDWALKSEVGPNGNNELRILFPRNRDDQLQLERLLANAAEDGMIAFNDAVRSGDGSVNGRVILYDLVERALLHGNQIERATGEDIATKALSLTKRTGSVATEQTTTESTGGRFYTVQSGDSLAYIALQFYGTTNSYLAIFEANRDKISSPEKIQIGQKLLIPET